MRREGRIFTEVTDLGKEIFNQAFSPSQTVQAPLLVALIRPILVMVGSGVYGCGR